MNPSGQNNPYSQFQYYGQPALLTSDTGFSQSMSQTSSHVSPNVVMPMQMMYNNGNQLPVPFSPQVVAQQYSVQHQLLSPGALARQNRASAESRRGKRRKHVVESGGEDASQAVSGEGSRGYQQGEDQPISLVKDERRKKRLLRNRVSAQQARERKRTYMTDLEEKCDRLRESNLQLEEEISELSKENEELRSLVRNNVRSSNPTNSTLGSGKDLEQSEPGISRPKASMNRRIEILGFSIPTESDSGAKSSE